MKIKGVSIVHYLFTLPALLLMTIFFMYPMVDGIYYSLTDWNGISKEFNFVGLKNYISIFSDKRINNSVNFTITYTILLVFGVILLSLILALVLDSKVIFKKFFRSVFLFPTILSLITVGMVFNQIFYSVLPAIGKALNIQWLSKNILSDPKTAIYGILVVAIWQGVALPTLLFIAGLQSVPISLLEAAEIDGANAFQKLKKIVFPYLIPSFNMVFILTLKAGLTVFDYIMTMTNGGPGKATESVGVLIYKYAFTELKYSYSLTVSLMLFIVIIIVSVIQMKVLRKFEVE